MLGVTDKGLFILSIPLTLSIIVSSRLVPIDRTSRSESHCSGYTEQVILHKSQLQHGLWCTLKIVFAAVRISYNPH